MEAAISEIFLNPEVVTNVSNVFYAVGNGIKFDCYPETGNNFCSNRKPRICPG